MIRIKYIILFFVLLGASIKSFALECEQQHDRHWCNLAAQDVQKNYGWPWTCVWIPEVSPTRPTGGVCLLVKITRD